ncbi:hypothetical protein EJB05_27528, partial [Eragrostis curvula]
MRTRLLPSAPLRLRSFARCRRRRSPRQLLRPEPSPRLTSPAPPPSLCKDTDAYLWLVDTKLRKDADAPLRLPNLPSLSSPADLMTWKLSEEKARLIICTFRKEILIDVQQEDSAQLAFASSCESLKIFVASSEAKPLVTSGYNEVQPAIVHTFLLDK